MIAIGKVHFFWSNFPKFLEPKVVDNYHDFNPLSANPTKWSNTLKHFVGNLPTNCLSVFDHFVRLRLIKGLRKYCAFNNLVFASFYPVINSFINFLSLGWILTIIFSTNIYKIHNFFKTLYANRIRLN